MFSKRSREGKIKHEKDNFDNYGYKRLDDIIDFDKKDIKIIENIDKLVDSVLAKNKYSSSCDEKVKQKHSPDKPYTYGGNRKHFRVYNKKVSLKKVLSVLLPLILLFVVIPSILPFLHGDISDLGVSVSIWPENIGAGDPLFINVTIPASYHVVSVTADTAGIETINLSLINNSSTGQLWQAVWVVHNVSVGEHIITVSALDELNTSYVAGVRWSVLPENISDGDVVDEEDDDLTNETDEWDSENSSNVTTVGYTNISAGEAKEMIDSNLDVIFLDLRTIDKYRHSHIPDAVSMPLDEFLCSSCVESKLRESENNIFIFYAQNTSETKEAFDFLTKRGFKDFYMLEGGFDFWENAGFKLNYSTDKGNLADKENITKYIDTKLDRGKPVFLYFYSDLCGYCSQQKPIINSLKENFSKNIGFIDINCDKYPDIKAGFNVTGTPSIFLIASKGDGSYIYKYFKGLIREDALVYYIENVLEDGDLDLSNDDWWQEAEITKQEQSVYFESEIRADIAENGRTRVIVQFEDTDGFLDKLSNLEEMGFVKEAAVPSKNIVAGYLDSVVYERMKYEDNILVVKNDTAFKVFLGESLSILQFDRVEQDFNLTGMGKKICILDTGVDHSIVDYSYGYDFVNDDNVPEDEYGHGTQVASVIKSIAPNAELVVAKVINRSGRGFESDVIEGLQWCIDQNPDIISFSIGSMGSSTGFCDVNLVASMGNNATEQGIFVVAAAGNDGYNRLVSPACGSNVFSVGATDDNDVITSFSNVHPILDMFAPGENITTAAGTGSGTSFSVPHVAGAALLLLENEDLTPSEMKYKLRSTGRPIEYTYNATSPVINISRLDVYNAITNNKTMEPYNYSGWDQALLFEGEYEPQDFICFMPDTPINMADGTYKQIQDVKVGEWVKVFDEETGIVEDAPVKSIQTIMHTSVHELYLSNGKMLRPTANHPFFTQDKGWATISGLDELNMGAGKLEIDDYLYCLNSDGELEKVKAIDIIPVEGNYLTYNFVDMKHGTFLADDIVTHNSICFVGDTKITMADGNYKYIKDVAIGEMILSWDFEKHKSVPALVRRTWKGPHDCQYTINGHINVTWEHPFWTREVGWASINPDATFEHHHWFPARIRVGYHMMDADGNYIEIKSIVERPGSEITYNLADVGENHNYFAEGFLVHNKEFCDCDTPCPGYTGNPCECFSTPVTFCSDSCEDGCYVQADCMAEGCLDREGCPCTAPPPDEDPPTPDPPTWATAPYETSSSSISMEANVCTDAYPSNPVQYVIREESGNPGWSDKGWNTVRTHTDSGLSENTQYSYRIRARDAIPNTGSFSALSYEYTDIDPPESSEFDLGGTITVSSISMTIDPDPPNEAAGSTAVYYDYVSGGTGGTDSGWDDFDSGYTDSGLAENTQYTYRAKFRNGDANDDGEYCSSESVYTYANPPANGQLDVADFGETWILWRLVDVDNNPDAGSTDGYFDIVTNPGGGSSGLSTSDDASYYYFNDTGLTAGQEYGMKARYDNFDGVDTTYCSEVKQTTTAAPPSNNAPTVDYKTPVNGTTGVSPCPAVTVQAYVNDTDGNDLNVTWATNESGSWVNKHTNASVSANTTQSYQFTNFSNYSITYYWKVYVHDGTDNISETYHFTTSVISTSVDSISPYNQTSSSITINATGDSCLNNVIIWYRNSSDNSSWSSWMQNVTDSASPWQWTFNFTNANGTSYYEFYSIGNKSGSTDESAPGSKDAMCHYEPQNTTINVTPATWNIGTVTVGSNNYSTSNNYFTLANEGNVNINVQIKGNNATNATTGAEWKLASTPSCDNFSLKYNKSGDASWTIINTTYDTFCTNLAASTNQTFDLNLYVATTSSKDDPLSFYITFKSVAN